MALHLRCAASPSTDDFLASFSTDDVGLSAVTQRAINTRLAPAAGTVPV